MVFLPTDTYLVTKEQLFIQLVEQLSSQKLFYGHAVIDAQDEAMMVMMHIYKQDVDAILATGNIKVEKVIVEEAILFVKKRLSSLKPMAYILGQVNFCGLMFNSDERALVPRSPIAELIQNGFDPWVNMDKVFTALDMCTGSGCIGLALANYYAHIHVDISDISHIALTLAQENINKLSIDANIIQSDIFENIKNSYDLIVTNPPYVSGEEYDELPREYKHEPKLGLVTEQQGFKIPVEIMLKAPNFLNDNGFLFLEVGYSDKLLEAAFPQISFEWIDFLNGGQGVCVFSKKMLLEYQPLFKIFLETKHVI